MDDQIAELLGLDPGDPDTEALAAAASGDMDLIERLVQVRRDQGLSQRQVAERMECSQPNVSNFERVGGDPHLSTIRRYATAVGARVHWSVTVAGGRSPGFTFSPIPAPDHTGDFYRKVQ